MDEQKIDQMVSRNNQRAAQMQQHIDRILERQKRFTDENVELMAEKEKIKKVK